MWVADHNPTSFSSQVDSIFKLYHQAGFQVTKVCADQDLANAQEHVPETECNNHILKVCIGNKHVSDMWTTLL